MKFTFRDMAWIAVVVLIVLYLAKCHRDKRNGLDEGIKKLQDKVIKDSIERINRVNAFERKVYTADSVVSVYTTRNRLIEQQLNSKTATVLRLSALIKEYEQPGNSNFITVGQEYLDYCDSLADESTSMVIDFDKYKKNTAYLLAAKDTAISYRDGLISTERKALQNSKQDYNALMRFYSEQSKSIKPGNQVYVGAEIIGNPAYLVSNVGVVLTLKTKSNKLWQVSGGMQTNGLYYARINGNILIKLKP